MKNPGKLNFEKISLQNACFFEFFIKKLQKTHIMGPQMGITLGLVILRSEYIHRARYMEILRKIETDQKNINIIREVGQI